MNCLLRLMTMSMLNKQDPLHLSVPSHRNNVNCSASVSDYITVSAFASAITSQ